MRRPAIPDRLGNLVARRGRMTAISKRNTSYDAIVIGGGVGGLSPQPTWRGIARARFFSRPATVSEDAPKLQS